MRSKSAARALLYFIIILATFSIANSVMQNSAQTVSSPSGNSATVPVLPKLNVARQPFWDWGWLSQFLTGILRSNHAINQFWSQTSWPSWATLIPDVYATTPVAFDAFCVDEDNSGGTLSCNLVHAANVVVMISITQNAIGTPCATRYSSITFNGSAASALGCDKNNAQSDHTTASWYYVYSGSSGTHTVSITSSSAAQMNLIASSYTNANGSFESTVTSNGSNSGTGQFTVTQAISAGTTGRMIYAVCGKTGGNGGGANPSTDSPLTQITTQTGNNHGTLQADGYDQTASGITQSCTFTATAGSNSWAMIGTALLATPTVTDQFTQSGLAGDVAGSQVVLTIDSVPKTKSVLPVSYTDTPSVTTHTVACTTPITGSSFTYDFSSWTNGSGLVTCSGTFTAGASDNTATANYMVRPTIIFAQSGLTADVSSGTTVVTIDATPYTKGTMPTFTTWAVSSTHTVSCVNPVVGSSYHWHFSSWTNGNGLTTCSSGTYTTPASDTTSTITYVNTVSVTFTQSGLASDVAGSQVVLSVDAVNKTKTDLPFTTTYTELSAHTVTCTTPITGSSYVYDFTSWTNPEGLSTCASGTWTTPLDTVTSTANYQAEGAITFNQSGLTGDVAAGTTVITIDGTPYAKSALPVNKNWVVGSTHSVACATPITGTSYVWDFTSYTNPDGLASCSGTYTAGSGTITVTANYTRRHVTTWAQTGVGGDVAGGTTVLTIASSAKSLSQFPLVVNTYTDGQTVSVACSNPIAGSSFAYAFVSWTNGNGLTTCSGTFTMPASDVTVTVNYAVEDFVVTNSGNIGVPPTGSGANSIFVNNASGATFDAQCSIDWDPLLTSATCNLNHAANVQVILVMTAGGSVSEVSSGISSVTIGGTPVTTRTCVAAAYENDLQTCYYHDIYLTSAGTDAVVTNFVGTSFRGSTLALSFVRAASSGTFIESATSNTFHLTPRDTSFSETLSIASGTNGRDVVGICAFGASNDYDNPYIPDIQVLVPFTIQSEMIQLNPTAAVAKAATYNTGGATSIGCNFLTTHRAANAAIMIMFAIVPLNTPVSFTVSISCTGGLPTGATCGFAPSSGTVSYTSTLTITTSSAAFGSYIITVTGTNGVTSHNTTFTLIVGGGILTYVSETITQTALTTTQQTATTVSTTYNLANKGQVDYTTMLFVLIMPLAVFLVIGWFSTRGSPDGIAIGALLGLGIGLIINIYLNNVPQWLIVPVVIAGVAYIAAKVGGYL